MRRIIYSLLLMFVSFYGFTQSRIKTSTGTFSGPFVLPLTTSTTKEDLLKPNWQLSFEFLYRKSKTDIFHTKELKNKKMTEKNKSIEENSFEKPLNKRKAPSPKIGINFKGNDVKSWTPTDNSIAVSNDGFIISCTNQGFEYYNTEGAYIIQNQAWSAFVNDTNLNQAKFDPRVIYDNIHDRFIVVMLHGFSSNSSKILACFSKTNNPLEGWNIYALPGNPFNDTSWTDYPTIGVSDDELFINGNRFSDESLGYKWRGTYIYQIGLNEGYDGNALQYGLWKDIKASDGEDGITLYPAMNGLGNSMKEKMNFVFLRPDSGSHVYLFQIKGTLNSSNKTMTSTRYDIPHYEVCASAYELDESTGNIDSLSTGSAWTQNAFTINNTIHFTYAAETRNGWCGVHYGRIYENENKATTTNFGIQGTDMAYPAVASLGYDSLDNGVAIAFLRSDKTITPEVDIVAVDHDMNWSNFKTVKEGDTLVNIIRDNNQPERWGDYTGISRKQNATTPEIWLAGAIATNTLPRRASWGTWVSQIITDDTPRIPYDENQPTTTNIFPNPVADIFTIEFENEQAGNVIINLYDVQGNIVKKIFDDYLSKSKDRISFNKNMLSTGIYFIKIIRENQLVSTHKITVE